MAVPTVLFLYASIAMARLDEAAVRKAVQELPGWTLDGNAIRRQFTLASFPDAIAFVTRLAFDAEAADHHPDILVNYKRVTLTYSTHSEGGLTQKDFDGARKADALAKV
jgi:4a-hydroxytetrahydrobiopterin dehydratase